MLDLSAEESSEGVPSTRQSAIAKSEKVIDKDKFISYQRAKTFTSANPFFISFMQPSYVTYSCKLVILANFRALTPLMIFLMNGCLI